MKLLRGARSAWVLSLLTAVLVVAVNNRLLFAALLDKLPLATPQGLAYLLLILGLMVGTLLLIFLLAGFGPLLKPLLAAMLLLSAVLGYFTNELGIVFDLEMFRNVAETLEDGNAQEATELLSMPLALYVAAFGLLPALGIWLIPVKRLSFAAELRTRGLCLLAFAVFVIGVGLPNYKYLTYFSVEHRDLRFEVTPIFSILSAAKYIKRRPGPDSVPFQRLGADAVREVGRRRVGVVVVGETARADHFSLGENGVYLHGLPYVLAPPSQTRVPLIAWLSPRLAATQRAAAGRDAAASRRLSHDNISHTLLGLFDVNTVVYRQDQDLFRGEGFSFAGQATADMPVAF